MRLVDPGRRLQNRGRLPLGGVSVMAVQPGWGAEGKAVFDKNEQET